MQKKFYFIFVALICAILIGCPVNEKTDEPQKQSTPLDSFYGSWANAYPVKPYDDWFTLKDNNTFIYYNNGDPTNDIAYQGTVVSGDVSGDYVFANIKVTQITGRSPWGFAIDSYCRVCFQKVSDSQVKMSTGCLPVSYDQTTDTIENLKSKFTFENNAFGYFGDYNKK